LSEWPSFAIPLESGGSFTPMFVCTNDEVRGSQVCWMAESSPFSPARSQEGQQFGDLAPLAASNDTVARAYDHAALERKFHRCGRIINTTFAPSFRQIAW
jgi:hypothetical protein